MSLWQAPFRPPPIRSKAVVRVHRKHADGSGGDYAPQPISPPDIIPLRRGFWATYGVQTGACLVILLASIWLGWSTQRSVADAGYGGYDAGAASGSMLVWLCGIVALVTAFLPFFFYARFRRLEKVFGGDEMYDSEEPGRGSCDHEN